MDQLDTSRQLLAQLTPVASGFADEKLGGDCTGFGPLCVLNDATDAVKMVANIVSTIIGFITVIAGIFFMLQFMISGFEYLSAAGDKNKLQSAQHRMMYAVIGLMVIVSTYAVTTMMAEILGFDSFLLRNPGNIINSLKP